MKSFYKIILFISFPLVTFSQNITLQKICDGIISPVAMANAGDGSKRIFICEQFGVIRIFKNNQLVKEPFLDIRDRIIKQMNLYSERGLLGIAFHPLFKTNHKFYIYYSAKSSNHGSDHKSIIAEYKVSANNPDKAEVSSERIVMQVEQPESNHNGGQLLFGADGFLYVGLGDGGGAGDDHGEQGNGQNLETLLGKILRIDVDVPNAYRIPHDNPFVGKKGKDEIWAYGLRNPWKFSFDEKSGKLFCADVGQDLWEEVDIIEKGKNYGWRVMEGNHCYNPASDCLTQDLQTPIAEYDHKDGISIIGGYVYHGKNQDWNGRYIFGDWNGKLFAISPVDKRTWKRSALNVADQAEKFRINSFGEDEDGEIYVLAQQGIGPEKAGGILYRIIF